MFDSLLRQVVDAELKKVVERDDCAPNFIDRAFFHSQWIERDPQAFQPLVEIYDFLQYILVFILVREEMKTNILDGRSKEEFDCWEEGAVGVMAFGVPAEFGEIRCEDARFELV